jgi:hypothetical protein
MSSYRFEQRFFAQALAAAAPRITQTIGEEHKQIAFWIPLTPNGPRVFQRHAQWRIIRGEPHTIAIRADDKSVWVPGIRVKHLAPRSIDHAIKGGDEHFGRRELVADGRE